MRPSNSLRVLFIASESAPFVKIGGLGDVAGSLPRALRALASLDSPENSPAVDVRLAIPFHAAIPRQDYALQRVAAFSIDHMSGRIPAEAYLTEVMGVPVYLIASPAFPPNAPVYSNDWGFDAHKYIFFSLATLELARALEWPPDVVHANDWHTAAAVYALSLRRPYDPFFHHTATLLGLHNLPYMGMGGSFPLYAFYLPPTTNPALPEWARHLPLPLGLAAADHIVAVSPGYAQEILTAEYGAGLENFLRTRAADISGILNGLDGDAWRPDCDQQLSASYRFDDLGPRQINKSALCSELGLQVDPAVPLLAMVSRLDYQKGIDLAIQALRQVASLPQAWQVIVLGTGLPMLEASLLALQQTYPNRVRVITSFDVALSRRIYSGADVLLIPSRYEPCGLTQMIAMRYGCVPLARATGGLRDTIRDDGAAGTGYLFEAPTPEAMAATLGRMLVDYANPDLWQAMQINGMRQDFSWDRSARAYLARYQALTAARRGP